MKAQKKVIFWTISEYETRNADFENMGDFPTTFFLSFKNSFMYSKSAFLVSCSEMVQKITFF